MMEQDKPRTAPRASAARLALAVRKLREENKNLELIASDPIAIVGMGCRFPGGAETPEEFWNLLRNGRNCVGEIPVGRWADRDVLPAHMRRGGYIEEVEGFDPAYFGISPREARDMDPQQRLLLEVAWEALWDAGIEPASLAGTDAGVFLAIYNSDYSRLHFRDTSLLTAHAGIGAAHSVAAGRLSFLLNIQGPSLAIDSACSSSLVATHLGCQSLRGRECGLAIVGASSLKLLSDEVLVFSKWGMLASDGKCKTFDASADGFVPGEGCGVLVLKRLSDALQDGDRVHALIRGTAVNHDGRTTVLTAPNGLAQEAVLRAALRNAMLEPCEVTYIETHGTGTALGDPIEMEAVRNVYDAAGQDALLCTLGAVKTNLGHLEAAAGMAGLIKTALCLEHGEIPKNLHFQQLNPEISLAGSRFQIPTETVAWPREAQPRVAGISSFGLGGTNGHIILEEAPLVPVRGPNEGRTIPLPAHRWQRHNFPIAPTPLPTVRVPAAASKEWLHPLLEHRVESAFVPGHLFESVISFETYPYLSEHRLENRALMPFAAFLEIAAAAAHASQKTGASSIRNFLMCEPLFLSANVKLQVLSQDSSIQIASQSASGWRTNAKGSLATTAEAAERIDLATLQARCNRSISPDEVYRRLQRTGLEYGPSFRTIYSAWSAPEKAAPGEALVRLRLAGSLGGDAAQYGLHPTLLDGCLQAVAIARGDAGGALFLPISVDSFTLYQRGTAELWAHAIVVSNSPEAISVDLTMMDATGHVVAKLLGFTAKRTTLPQVGAAADKLVADHAGLTYQIAWRPVALNNPVKNQTGEHWLLVEYAEGSLRSLSNVLGQRGVSCREIRAGEFSPSIDEESPWTGVVFDARETSAIQAELWQHPEKSSIEFVLNFTRALGKFPGKAPRLCIVSSSAVAVLPGEDVSLEQAPLLGLVRTLGLEYPDTAATFLDAGPRVAASPSAVAETEKLIADEIAGGEMESLVAFRNGTRYVARLTNLPASALPIRRLQMGASGRLEDLRLEPSDRRDPKPHEIEIEVRAAGLNFRDVLTALGMLSVRSAIPGGECSGTIVRLGAEVSGWSIGDDVLAFAPGSFQSFVNVPAKFAIRKPSGLTFAEAAGIPIAFLTAEYGLMQLAKLSAGQTILIHAGAGGLGMAAVQLALRAGAIVFATAGSPEKRAFLHQLGVQHVFDSRSLAFREQVLEQTHGAGVDVVLNSLAGDFIRASFEVMAQNGCFLEVGKRGIWSAEEVEALKKNLRYYPFDLGDVALENPSTIAVTLRELMARFVAGDLHPLPTAIYDFENAADAFRTMAQARHIGKIVLGVSTKKPEADMHELLSEGSVLITGGLGALGIETARWLAIRGARKIILAGRSAQPGEPYPIASELRAQGVEVVIERADVASFEQMQQLFERMRAAGPQLTAVFHAAGVVEDAVLQTTTWNSYREATAPKIQGAWNLHRLTQNDPPPLMVFFSSAASILGSPGQGSYAAGNAFLDAVAQHRASHGMRTLSVNWGAWAATGMAARLSPELAARSARQGSTPMEPADALRALQSAVERGSPQVAILDMNWQRFLGERMRPDAAFFADLDRSDALGEKRREDSSRATKAAVGILDQIRSAVPFDRTAVLSAHVKNCARHVLGLDEDAVIQDDVPLQDVGLDSLMALEMRNDLAPSLGLTLTAGLLFDYPSVDQLTQYLLGLLEKSESGGSSVTGTDNALEAVDVLSDEEAERLLIEELDRAEKEKTNV
ncbi:MAG: SDR family NAD(P)-dependent oxidoreductase [Acidobacteriaceae bacterium]